MQRVTPSFGRIATMALFALSCFGLLLFLWISFGGPIPLQPKGYRFEAAFPKAYQLGPQADVRESGVSIGKVVGKTLSPDGRRTLATIEIDHQYAPLHADARAMLRTKTVGGETYVAVTRGTPGSSWLRDGSRLPDKQVGTAQTIEDVLQLFDTKTRRRFGVWQQSLGQAVGAHGRDINNAIGSLPPLTSDATDALGELDADRRSLSRLVSDTATVFDAISADTGALQSTVTGLNTTFSATAAQDRALAQTFSLFPSFLRSSRVTLRDATTFAHLADPVVVALRPALEELPPTVHQARLLAPDLRHLFENLGPAYTAAIRGLPQTASLLRRLRPLLGELGPFLEELNPTLRWLEINQGAVSDFFSAGITALGATAPDPRQDTLGHFLRQLDPGGPESAAVWQSRLPNNRNNPYPMGADTAKLWEQRGIQGSFDCINAGGERAAGPDGPPCYVQKPATVGGKQQGRFPHLEAGP